MPTSWKPEVIADSTGQWYPNGLAFATRVEAENYAHNLSQRWLAVLDWRVVESDEPVNHTFHNGTLAYLGDSTS